MKNRFYLIIITFISSYSITAYSQNMTAMIKQQMQISMAIMCNDRNFLACSGLSQNECNSAVVNTIAACDHLFPTHITAMNDNSFDRHSDCIQYSFPKISGINLHRLEACNSNDHHESHDENEDMADGIAMMNQALQQHAETVGTDDVTLPIYKNARVMSHFSSGEMTAMHGVKPLPALVMTSPDSTTTIASYYRKKLTGFREHNFNGDILFMQGGPKYFDYVQDYETYAVTPHVLISPLQHGSGVPAGTQSKIEIAYKK